MLSTSLLKILYEKLWEDVQEERFQRSFLEKEIATHSINIILGYLQEVFDELHKRGERDFLTNYPMPKECLDKY